MVFAHPDGEGSFSAAIRDAASKGLQAAGFTVEILDLYALGFDAAMSRTERLAYVTDQPIVDPMVSAHAELVSRAHTLVFVYPTWWWGMPAVMKGWLERVMVAGVAFTLDARTGRFRPGLRRLRRIVGVSTYSASRPTMRLFNDCGRRVLRRGLRLSAPRARTKWFGLYDVDADDGSDRAMFLERIEHRMARL